MKENCQQCVCKKNEGYDKIKIYDGQNFKQSLGIVKEDVRAKILFHRQLDTRLDISLSKRVFFLEQKANQLKAWIIN